MAGSNTKQTYWALVLAPYWGVSGLLAFVVIYRLAKDGFFKFQTLLALLGMGALPATFVGLPISLLLGEAVHNLPHLTIPGHFGHPNRRGRRQDIRNAEKETKNLYPRAKC